MIDDLFHLSINVKIYTFIIYTEVEIFCALPGDVIWHQNVQTSLIQFMIHESHDWFRAKHLLIWSNVDLSSTVLLNINAETKLLPFCRRHFQTHFFRMGILEFQLKFHCVPKGPMNNIPALVQIMAWLRPGDNRHLNQWWLEYWGIYASFGLNELTFE